MCLRVEEKKAKDESNVLAARTHLLDGADARQDVGLLPVEDVPDLLGGHEVLVDLLLDGGQPATDHLRSCFVGRGGARAAKEKPSLSRR